MGPGQESRGIGEKTVFWGLLAAGRSGAAQANAFDDCVPKNMQGATSDVAAKSIKVA